MRSLILSQCRDCVADNTGLFCLAVVFSQICEMTRYSEKFELIIAVQGHPKSSILLLSTNGKCI